MITKKDKERIIAAFDTVDVKQMNIEHEDMRLVKWFRFGSYNGILIAKEIIRQLPEKTTSKKIKVTLDE